MAGFVPNLIAASLTFANPGGDKIKASVPQVDNTQSKTTIITEQRGSSEVNKKNAPLGLSAKPENLTTNEKGIIVADNRTRNDNNNDRGTGGMRNQPDFIERGVNTQRALIEEIRGNVEDIKKLQEQRREIQNRDGGYSNPDERSDAFNEI